MEAPKDTGGSWGLNDGVVRGMLSRTIPASVFDMGCGHGKYAAMFRELGLRPRIVGVDSYAPTIEYLKTTGLYSELFNEEIGLFDIPPCDMVIFGDVLEHLKRSQVVALLEKLGRERRVKYVIAVVPLGDKPQSEMGGNPAELHQWAIEEDEFLNIAESAGLREMERHVATAKAKDGDYQKMAVLFRCAV
jgi:SAM-dependent methyltransferase